MTRGVTVEDANDQFHNGRPGRLKVELVRTNVFTRWPCHVCGGATDKDAVLAQAANGFRICPECLKAGDFDARLDGHARKLEKDAAELRSLIGTIDAPTHAQWEAAMREDCIENCMRWDGLTRAEAEMKIDRDKGEWRRAMARAGALYARRQELIAGARSDEAARIEADVEKWIASGMERADSEAEARRRIKEAPL
jgi:hypothetical protein